MAAHDAQSYLDFTSSDSWTHTPTGTPRGIVVHIAQNVVSTDLITAVTYGGVRMNRVASVADTTTEPGRVYTYFLGVGIPTGAQTVAVTVASGTDAKTAWCQSLTGSSDLELVTYASVTDDQVSPRVTLATVSSFSGVVSAVLYSGTAAPGSVSAGTGYTKLTGSAAGGRDFGNSAAIAMYGAQSGEAVYADVTVILDDVALLAVAVGEAGSATRADLYQSTSTWICPPGVTSVTVLARGGGGGGGGVAADTNNGSGGGAGGQMARSVLSVTPGTTYTVTVGAGGTAGASTGGDGGVGGDSWFDSSSTIIAKGGAGGLSFENGFTGGAGSTTSGIGDTVYAGGDGGDGGNFNGSGGGGNGGGSDGTGTNGTTGTSGVPGPGGVGRDGGRGGNGVLNAAGQAGVAPGGGGGGGSVGANATNRAGGAGGIGRVTISYLTPTTEQLTDDFGDASRNAAKWQDTVDAGTAVTEGSGILDITTTASAGGAYIRSDHLYKLLGSYVSSKVVDEGNQAADLDYVAIKYFGENEVDYIAIIVSFDLILAHTYIDGVDANLRDDTTFSTLAPEQFRIREASGTVYFEYYDGAAWQTYTSGDTEDFFALTGGKQGFEAYVWGSAATSTSQFDDFNILPSPPSSGGTPLLMLMGMGT